MKFLPLLEDIDSGGSYYRIIKNEESFAIADLPVNTKICITKQGYIPKELTISLIQNETISTSKTYTSDVVIMGSNLTSRKASGNVSITGGDITIKAPYIVLGAGTKIENTGKFKLTTN